MGKQRRDPPDRGEAAAATGRTPRECRQCVPDRPASARQNRYPSAAADCPTPTNQKARHETTDRQSRAGLWLLPRVQDLERVLRRPVLIATFRSLPTLYHASVFIVRRTVLLI